VGKRVVGALFVVPLMRMVELPSRVLYLASLIKKQLASLIKKQLASLIKKQLASLIKKQFVFGVWV
jgi:hypothetical protein